MDQAEAARIAEEQALQTQSNQPEENQPNQNETQGLSVQLAEQRPNFIETHKTETVSGALIVIAAALWGIDFKFFRPNKMIIAGANREKKRALEEVLKLDSNVGKGITLFDAIASVYGESYPDDAEATRKEEADFRAKIDSLQEAKKELLAISISFFQGRGWANSEKVTDEIKEKAKNVRDEAAELLALISEKSDLFDNLNEQKVQSGSNVDKVKMEIDELETWYDEKLSVPSYRSILPPRDTAFTEMNSRYEEAFNNVRMNPQFELEGSNQAVELSKTIIKFKAAVEAFTSSYETSLALHLDASTDLAKWPDKAISMKQLGNSGSKLLNEAKPGISIPDKFDEVIELSRQAKEEFISAKDFASATANVLALQDENNKAIAEIEEEGFEDKHITSFREEMTEALTQANSLATLGKWKEAQAQLGILRVKTNEALVEMQRVQKLRKQNIRDLASLAKDVEEGKTKYRNDVTKAWNALQSYKSANYDETQEIWKELRPKSTQTAEDFGATDLRSDFFRIASLLEEITDDQSSQTDLASRAADKNSFAKQEFDDAAALIRQMEEKMAQADQMMNKLINRQILVIKAEKEYRAAIENAQSRLAAASESVDEPEEKRFTDDEVRGMIEESGKLIELAQKAGKALVFVVALEAANRAADLAIQGKKNADDQVKEIRRLLSQLESHKNESESQAQAIIKIIDEEAPNVVTDPTKLHLKALKLLLDDLAISETGLAAKENTQLNQGLQDLLDDLSTIDSFISRLKQLYEKDKSSYNELLNNLQSAIEGAMSQIEIAENECGKIDAGSAGDLSLSSATSTMPKMAELGDARVDTESKIKAAGRAKDYAKTAYTQATAAIKDAEDDRRAEQERLERIEEAKREAERERQRAADRAANERRQSEARRTAEQSHSRRSS